MRRAKFGIFDVDTRQVKNTGGWTYVARTLPFRDQIERLVNLATKNDVPLVVTTCVRGNMLPKEEFEERFDDTLFIPMNSDDTEWKSRCDSYNVFYVEKKFRRVDFPNDNPFPPHEIFLNSSNAGELIQKLGIDEWIVIGNAMETCGDMVIVKLLEHCSKVHYVPELMIPGVKCQNCDPVEFKNNVFETWKSKHVGPLPLEHAYRRVEAAMDPLQLVG